LPDSFVFSVDAIIRATPTTRIVRLGLRGQAWQSLYHFTTGGPVDDARLTTLPPYQVPR